MRIPHDDEPTLLQLLMRRWEIDQLNADADTDELLQQMDEEDRDEDEAAP